MSNRSGDDGGTVTDTILLTWLLLVTVAFTFDGCLGTEDLNSLEHSTLMVSVGIVTDEETGCEYLVRRGLPGASGGITPRLGTGGEPICNPKGTTKPAP